MTETCRAYMDSVSSLIEEVRQLKNRLSESLDEEMKLRVATNEVNNALRAQVESLQMRVGKMYDEIDVLKAEKSALVKIVEHLWRSGNLDARRVEHLHRGFELMMNELAAVTLGQKESRQVQTNFNRILTKIIGRLSANVMEIFSLIGADDGIVIRGSSTFSGLQSLLKRHQDVRKSAGSATDGVLPNKGHRSAEAACDDTHEEETKRVKTDGDLGEIFALSMKQVPIDSAAPAGGRHSEGFNKVMEEEIVPGNEEVPGVDGTCATLPPLHKVPSEVDLSRVRFNLGTNLETNDADTARADQPNSDVDDGGQSLRDINRSAEDKDSRVSSDASDGYGGENSFEKKIFGNNAAFFRAAMRAACGLDNDHPSMNHPDDAFDYIEDVDSVIDEDGILEVGLSSSSTDTPLTTITSLSSTSSSLL